MGEYSEAFVAFDVAKQKHAVAVAEGGRRERCEGLSEFLCVRRIQSPPPLGERL